MSDVDSDACQLCCSPLIVQVNGKRWAFTAHTPEFCRLMTLERIKMLESIAKQATVREEYFRASHREACRVLDEMNHAIANESNGEAYLAFRAPDIDRARLVNGPASAREITRERTPEEQHEYDKHHSMGLEVAEIISGTPLAKRCEACKAPIGAQCVPIEGGYPPITGPDYFHSVRRER